MGRRSGSQLWCVDACVLARSGVAKPFSGNAVAQGGIKW
jgi:hypothetical protein